MAEPVIKLFVECPNCQDIIPRSELPEAQTVGVKEAGSWTEDASGNILFSEPETIDTVPAYMMPCCAELADKDDIDDADDPGDPDAED